ncbi:MAG: hypothetical protein JSS83_23385 [Cyanobacteria bacterium SZAS LIN-3]|nr:hypothetical protein [Cyanobacteria bacterium SZAS LIN-3]
MPEFSPTSSRSNSPKHIIQPAKLIYALAIAIACPMLVLEPASGGDLTFHIGPPAMPPFPGIEGLQLSKDQTEALYQLGKKLDPDDKNAAAQQLRLDINPATKDQIDTDSSTPYQGIFQLDIHEVELNSYRFMRDLPCLQKASVMETSPGQLNQSLIDALSTCRALKGLQIMGPLASVDLAVLRRLPQLRRLSLAQCDISPTTIEQISKITTLKMLVLDRCRIVPSRPLNIAQLNFLEAIKLIGEMDNDSNVVDLKKMPQLKEVFLCGIVSSNQMAALASLKNLETLSINSDINDEDLKPLVHLPKLQALEIRSRKMTGQNLDAFRNAVLTYLNLHYCPLSKRAFSSIAKTKTLKALDLSSTPATDDDIKALSSLPHLSRLILYGMDNATPYGASVVSRAIPDCLIDGTCCHLSDDFYWNHQSEFRPTDANRAALIPFNSTLSGGSFAELESHLLKALELSENAEDYNAVLKCRERLADLYLNCTLYEKAIVQCHKSLDDLPLYQIRLNRASNQEAFKKIEIACACRQNEIRARLCLSECLRRTNRIDESNSVLIDLPPVVAENEPNQNAYRYPFYNFVVGVRHHSKDVNERTQKLLALTDFANEDYIRSQGITLREKMATQYLYAGDLKTAEELQREAYNEALAKSDKRNDVLEKCEVLRANILIRKEQFAEAEQILKPILARGHMTDGNPYDFASVCDQYAELLKATSRPDEAAVVSNQAMNMRMNPPKQFFFH